MCTPNCGRLTVWLLSCQAFWAFGCGGDPPRRSPTEVSLSQLASYYGRYVSAHEGKGPATEAQLRAFIADKSPAADVDSLFRSKRDGQAYVIVYSSSAKPGDVIAYEREGRDGRRFVALSTTEVREMDEPTFRMAISKK